MKDDPVDVDDGLRARILHGTPNRTRFRIAGARGDDARIASMVAGIESLPGVERVAWNPTTATLLVHHGRDLSRSELSSFAARNGYFSPDTALSIGTPVQQARNLYRHLEQQTLAASGGRVDVESVTLLILGAFAAAGIMRGNVAISTATAAWYALDMIRRPSRHEPPDPFDREPADRD